VGQAASDFVWGLYPDIDPELVKCEPHWHKPGTWWAEVAFVEESLMTTCHALGKTYGEAVARAFGFAAMARERGKWARRS
jgi:hypothetical protein